MAMIQRTQQSMQTFLSDDDPQVNSTSEREQRPKCYACKVMWQEREVLIEVVKIVRGWLEIEVDNVLGGPRTENTVATLNACIAAISPSNPRLKCVAHHLRRQDDTTPDS